MSRSVAPAPTRMTGTVKITRKDGTVEVHEIHDLEVVTATEPTEKKD